ncbi:MAG: hypothetical protein II817_12860 [Bacteroidales bacterium]|nr:hypothetical protein [Bacteroidales bacterium]
MLLLYSEGFFMTVTIKEITDKFYEVIDRYEEHEDWWEESEIKPKIEYLIPFRNELEQVAVNYLEETDDTDDFVTAFAAFCTCVIRYDLVERDDWTYYDALKSIVASMSEKIFPEYFDECDDFKELLESICYVIVYNDYASEEFLDKLIELYAQWNYSVLGLFLFCLFACSYDAENDNEKIKILKIINNHINDDTRDYALDMNLYAQNRDSSINEASYRRLLPFCLFASERELITNAMLSVYETVRSRLGFKEDDKIDIPTLCKHFVNMTESHENEQRITSAYFYDFFDKLDTLKKTSHEHPAWYSGFIDRKESPLKKNLAMHIPAETAFSTRAIYKDIQLVKATEDKRKAMEDKEEMLSDFSHRFKNMRATSLFNVAKALMAMDDEELKGWGRTVLLEYGVKKDIIKEVEMLRLRYQNEQERLLSIIHKSMSDLSNGCNGIMDIVNKSIVRCITTIMYDDSSEPEMIRNYCLKDYNIDDLGDKFEEEVLFSEKSDAISWLSKNIFSLDVTISDSWKKLYFHRDRGMEILLTDLMNDLIMNDFKYADKDKTVRLDFSESGDVYIIKTSNRLSTNIDNNTKRIIQNKIGLQSQNSFFNFLNSACGINENSIVKQSRPDGLFSIEIKICKKLFVKDENDDNKIF